MVIVVLGRLLDSGDFGVVAAAISVTVILHSIRDIGLGPALIQRKQLDRAHISTAFAVSAYLGIGIALLLVLTAPLIGAVYRIPESVDVLRALGAIFALRGVGATSAMLCQRAMNFRAVAIVDTGSYAAGAITSIVLAFQGAGAWALVGGYLVEEALSAISYFCLNRPPITLRIERARLRDLLGFGTGQSIIQVAGVLATYGDNFIVGHSLGKHALGYYTRAYDLIKLPSAVFTSIVGNVLFPAFSRLQHEPTRLASGYRRLTFANSLLLFPASALLIVMAPEVIHALMGPGWSDAVTPFRILAVTMMFRTHYKVAAMVASAAGFVNHVALANVLYMVVVIAGAALTVHWGIDGVAVSTAVGLCIVYSHCTVLALRASSMSPRPILLAHLPGLALASLVGAVGWLCAGALRTASFPFGIVLGAVTGAGLLVGSVAVATLARAKHGDFEWLGQELRGVAAKLRQTRKT